MNDKPMNGPSGNVRYLTAAAKISDAPAPPMSIGELSGDELDFLEKYRQLSPQDRTRVQRLLFRQMQK